jgi:serine/threonine-protein kinase HipA
VTLAAFALVRSFRSECVGGFGVISRAHVYIDDEEGEPRHVGEIFFTARAGRLSSTFRYSSDYLASSTAFAIDPALRLHAGAQSVSGLPGALRDCSPDRWGRNLIIKQARAATRVGNRAHPTLTEVDFLLGVSDLTREGALRFRVEPDGEFLAASVDVPKLLELPRLLRAADKVSRDDNLAAIKELLDAGTGSLGGARPKASVRDSERLLIAKFPHASDEWDVVAWEKTALDLAAKAGIRIPRSDLVKIQGRSVLLLERFDRHDGKRRPYISAMTLLEAGDGDPHDYAEIAEALSDVGAATTDDLRELWCRVAFSVLINNTDDHLRNHGFLREPGGWRLSPAFDVNPNPDPGVSRQTGIGGAYQWEGALDSLMDYAKEFRLTPTAAQETMARVAAAVATWRAAAAANGIHASEIKSFEDAFREP